MLSFKPLSGSNFLIFLPLVLPHFRFILHTATRMILANSKCEHMFLSFLKPLSNLLLAFWMHHSLLSETSKAVRKPGVVCLSGFFSSFSLPHSLCTSYTKYINVSSFAVQFHDFMSLYMLFLLTTLSLFPLSG